MFNKNKSIITLSLILGGLILLFSSTCSVQAVAWNPAPTSPPPADCPESNPGCHPPINVSVAPQEKRSSLTLGAFKAITDFVTFLFRHH